VLSTASCPTTSRSPHERDGTAVGSRPASGSSTVTDPQHIPGTGTVCAGHSGGFGSQIRRAHPLRWDGVAPNGHPLAHATATSRRTERRSQNVPDSWFRRQRHDLIRDGLLRCPSAGGRIRVLTVVSRTVRDALARELAAASEIQENTPDSYAKSSPVTISCQTVSWARPQRRLFGQPRPQL
jgi:hypothetical protein